MTYLTSSNEAAIIAAEARISINCGLPNGHGTLSWDLVCKAYNQDLWFITKPPAEGWGNAEQFAQAQMMDGVDMTDIAELEYDATWFEPSGEV